MSSPHEDRPGWANCFKVQKKAEDWQCDFTGVIALEGVGPLLGQYLEANRSQWPNVLIDQSPAQTSQIT